MIYVKTFEQALAELYLFTNQYEKTLAIYVEVWKHDKIFWPKKV
jgi:hypothetical protein